MSLSENGGARPRKREGFVVSPPEAPQPSDTTPQPPLPSQMTSEPAPLEQPLSDFDKIRGEIAAEREPWPVVVQLLYKPIKNEKGEELSSLSFREPRATEINRIGNPTRILSDGEVIIEERKMTYIMAALCGVLPPYLDAMDPRDWNSCAYRLRKFFLYDPRAW